MPVPEAVEDFRGPIPVATVAGNALHVRCRDFTQFTENQLKLGKLEESA